MLRLFITILLGFCSFSHAETAKPSPLKVASKQIVDSTLYLGGGVLAGSACVAGRVGWAVFKVTPWSSSVGKECLLFSKICGTVCSRSFKKIFKKSPSPLPSHTSWYLNQSHLRQIPALSEEDASLLDFLERRWLAKNTGYYATLVDWLCPSFGINLQVHPDSTGFYARDPSNKISPVYRDRVNNWKEALPHPSHFPLILTRPAKIQDFFPSCIEVSPGEQIEETVKKILANAPPPGAKIIIDLTHALPDQIDSRQEWLEAWQLYRDQFATCCLQHDLNTNQIICIQTLLETTRGGIRLLPLFSSKKQMNHHHQFLLEWVSKFGLTANTIELDRFPRFSHRPLPSLKSEKGDRAPLESQQELLSYFHNVETEWPSDHPQKNLMMKGILEPLKGLLKTVSASRWEEVTLCPTRSGIAQLSFSHIKGWLQQLKNDQAYFFKTTSHVEQIHAHFSALLEIFNPCTNGDFAPIFQRVLTTVPNSLKPLTSYGLHSSGMTSLTYVFKAAEKSLGTFPRILYGENTYFENIYTAERVASASCITDATEKEWREVDLILAQFNPALKRINFAVTEYHVEPVADYLHHALKDRAENKPLMLALDCTFDFINSQKVAALLEAFQEPIQQGKLNIVCYRSGIKFDLFGMDNYCGAPLYVIHNNDPHWTPFDTLLHHQALQTDQLSSNWFCLAYQHAEPYLEEYRKHIFDNTRAVLDQVPARLFRQDVDYRIIPVRPDADIGFIDIKIFGPLHSVRGSALVGGLFTINCLKKNHTLFYRPSVGFYHPNLSVLFSKRCTTVRLTVGLDPNQIEVLAETFKQLDALNTTPVI